jgi:hypothetical protein
MTPRVRAGEDGSWLRPRGHSDWPILKPSKRIILIKPKACLFCTISVNQKATIYTDKVKRKLRYMRVKQYISRISIQERKAMMRKVVTVAVVFKLWTYLM